MGKFGITAFQKVCMRKLYLVFGCDLIKSVIKLYQVRQLQSRLVLNLGECIRSSGGMMWFVILEFGGRIVAKCRLAYVSLRKEVCSQVSASQCIRDFGFPGKITEHCKKILSAILKTSHGHPEHCLEG